MNVRRSLWRLRQTLNQLNPAVRELARRKTKLADRFADTYWREVAAAAGATCELLGDGFRRLSRGDQWTLTLRGTVMLDSAVALKMAGNKPLMYRLMRDWGIHDIPRHCICTPTDPGAAIDLLQFGQLVAKPASGTGGGVGITTRIATEIELRRAVAVAARYADKILVEEHIEANSFRLLYLDGELIDAIWRRSPSVTGDGAATINQLVDKENTLRESSAPLRSTSLITCDRDYDNQLAHLGLSSRHVLEAGKVIAVKSVVNQNNSLENERVLDLVHESIRLRCAEICRHSRLQLVGVDLMADDVAKPWDDQRVIINELNTTPGLHHHVLTKTGSDDHRVGLKILERLFESARWP